MLKKQVCEWCSNLFVHIGRGWSKTCSAKCSRERELKIARDKARVRYAENPELYRKKSKEWKSTEFGKRYKSEYQKSEKYKAWRRKYRKSESQLAANRKYQKTEKRRIWKRDYEKTPKHRAWQRKHEKWRMRNDVDYRIRKQLQVQLHYALNCQHASKSNLTLKLLGCSVTELKAHLETQFKRGMAWCNYGQWEIDHKRPCASFDLKKKSQQKKCFHFSNLQPLWRTENRSKGARLL